MTNPKSNKLQVRDSPVDFLVFTKDAHEDGKTYQSGFDRLIATTEEE